MMGFDYLELDLIKQGVELLKLATAQCKKENECYDDVRFSKIADAKLEMIDKIIEKANSEQNKFYPTKLASHDSI